MFVQEQQLMRDDLGREVNLDTMVIGKLNPSTGKMFTSTMTIGSTLEFLCVLENAKLEAEELLYKRGGIVKTANGTKRSNEGVMHQIRRGKREVYSRPGGLTRDHFRRASAYIFQGRTDMQDDSKRILKFEAGWEAYTNVMQIFREEFMNQFAGLGNFMGTERSIPNPITGTLDALVLNPVKIKSAYIPGIGKLEVEYNPAMDYSFAADRSSRGFNGRGKSIDTYSLVIWDAGSTRYSNARTNLPNGTTLMKGGDSTSNVYYVKPEGAHVHWGVANGRWSPETASNVVSSLNTMSREFWIHSASAGWVKDITRTYIIELKR